MASNTEKLDAMVLGAIKSYTPDRPATRGDLFGMALIRKECIAVAGWSFNEPMHSLQRLKNSGKIKYSRKPAGWVAV